MTEIQKNFRVHRSLTGNSGSRGDKITLAQINVPSFDFKAQFREDLILQKDNWWIVKKSQPWAIYDCMIVDPGERQRSSFAQFSIEEIRSLFNLAVKVANILQNEGLTRIIIGANINHGIESSHLDKVLLRLHLHVLGFSNDELTKMQEISLNELKRKDPGIKNYLFDPRLAEFEEKILPILGSESVKSDFGINVDLRGGLDTIARADFSALVRKIDREIARQFSVLSYSFCLNLEDKVTLTISPRSVFGKGVLEAIGIILKRDDSASISPRDQEKREKFFEKVKEI